MRRHRASVKGGYRRTTLTIPQEVATRVDTHVASRPGLTWSAFVSEVLEHALPPERKEG